MAGHHPHILQPIEVYKGKIIFYCLGNFVHASPNFVGRTQRTMVARCRIEDKAVRRVSFVPARVNGQGQPLVLTPEEGHDVIDELEALSRPFGTRLTVETGDVTIEGGGRAAPVPWSVRAWWDGQMGWTGEAP